MENMPLRVRNCKVDFGGVILLTVNAEATKATEAGARRFSPSQLLLKETIKTGKSLCFGRQRRSRVKQTVAKSDRMMENITITRGLSGQVRMVYFNILTLNVCLSDSAEKKKLRAKKRRMQVDLFVQ